ncbi:hypothetical protein Bca101_065462 [Brassica carinata]
MQYYGTREKEYYDVSQGQSRQSNSQNHQGYDQSQSRSVYGRSPTLNHRSHGGFLDGLFKGRNSQKDQNGLGSFLGKHKSQEANKGHGHGKLLGQHQKTTHETNNTNGLGLFINNGEKKHKKQNEGKKKKKTKDGHESGSSSGSDSD